MGKKKKLPAKQQRFVEEYLVDLNATKAYERAGYKCNGPYGAKSNSSRLMANDAVAQEITRLKKIRSKRVEANADWVLKRLLKEADADLADLITEDGSVKDVKDMPMEWRRGLIAGIDVKEIDGVGKITRLKLSERIRRIELIGKHIDVGAFEEKSRLGVDLHGATRQDVEDRLRAVLGR